MVEKCDVVVVIAHPDDEIFLSGTLCLLAERGLKIALVCVTNGENGSRELFQHVKSNVELGEIRRRELALSAWVLGVSEVLFLGQPDIAPADWGGGTSWDRPNVIRALGRIILETSPKLILTHGPLGGYGHPAHREVYNCVAAAARDTSFSGSVFSFCGQVAHAFFSWRFDQSSDVLIDARSFLRRRVASLCYHQTQSEFFLRPYFPRTVRTTLSALYGLVFAFTEGGRKRVPIMTPNRFFKRFPVEGLALQVAGRRQPHFFLEQFRDDPRVRIVD